MALPASDQPLFDPTPWVRSGLTDPDASVRLEAVACATKLGGLPMVEGLLECSAMETDRWLDYALKESLLYFEPIWKRALAGDWTYADENPDAIDPLLASLSPEDLMALRRRPAVCKRLLLSPGIPTSVRREALDILGGAQGRIASAEWLHALKTADTAPRDNAQGLTELVHAFDSGDLIQHTPALLELAWNGRHPSIRKASLAAALKAQDHRRPQGQTIWQMAQGNPERLQSLLDAQSLLGPVKKKTQSTLSRMRHIDALAADPLGQSAKLGLPQNVSVVPAARYVRIELPKKAPLTLAEVEVYAGGENIAPLGEATQSSTAWGGIAARAIDGDRSPEYASGSQSHTAEGSENAFWELDLKSAYAIESIQIWNRQEGGYGRRLEGFHLILLDTDRRPVWERRDNPAPERSAEFVAQVDWPKRLGKSALRALVQAETPAPKTLAALPDMMASVPVEGRGASWYQDALTLLKRAGGVAETAALELSVFEVVFTEDGEIKADTALTARPGTPVELHIQNRTGRQVNLLLLEPKGSIPSDEPIDLEARKTFAMFCGSCHKPDGAGLVGPNMTDDHYVHMKSLEEMERLVRKGKEGTAMAAFENILDEEQLKAVVKFTASLRGTNPDGQIDSQGSPIPPFSSPTDAVQGMVAHSPVIDPGSTGILRFKTPVVPGNYSVACSLPGRKHLKLVFQVR